jgi:hypothetical protein
VVSALCWYMGTHHRVQTRHGTRWPQKGPYSMLLSSAQQKTCPMANLPAQAHAMDWVFVTTRVCSSQWQALSQPAYTTPQPAGCIPTKSCQTAAWLHPTHRLTAALTCGKHSTQQTSQLHCAVPHHTATHAPNCVAFTKLRQKHLQGVQREHTTNTSLPNNYDV